MDGSRTDVGWDVDLSARLLIPDFSQPLGEQPILPPLDLVFALFRNLSYFPS